MSDRFEKELASDVDDVVALPLLDELAASEESWKDFVEEDLQSMLEVFSILKMKPGDRIIAAGEYASFAGIILQGTFYAHVTPTLQVPLTAGETLGEMSLFEGGERNADVFTGTDADGCILAILTYNDLDQLAEMERYSALARKLRNLFATASIKKLRAMVNKAPQSHTTMDTASHARETLFQQKLGSASSSSSSSSSASSSTARNVAPNGSAPLSPRPVASGAAMNTLLVEMQRTIEERDATVADLKAQIEKLTAALAVATANVTASGSSPSSTAPLTSARSSVAPSAVGPSSTHSNPPSKASPPTKSSILTPVKSTSTASTQGKKTMTSPIGSSGVVKKATVTSPPTGTKTGSTAAPKPVVKKPAAK